MTDAAEAFFNRTPPEGYLDEWQQVLEAPPKSTEISGRSVLIFRLADERFLLTPSILLKSLHYAKSTLFLTEPILYSLEW